MYFSSSGGKQVAFHLSVDSVTPSTSLANATQPRAGACKDALTAGFQLPAFLLQAFTGRNINLQQQVLMPIDIVLCT